jgi:NADH pyrophosphatase NudC (nudix superfamily)
MSDFHYCPHCTAPLAERLIDGEPRRACSAGCGFVHYDNPTPVVAAIVEHDGCVVLARNRAWPATWYGLITGFLERGEAPAQGALREVKEELGLDAREANLVGVYPFDRMNQVIIAYHVPATGAIRLNNELADYRRVPPAKCRVWPFGTGDALRDWLRSRGFEPPVIERAR